MKAYFRKFRNALIPDGISSQEFLDKVKDDEIISVEVKRPRNYKFHKKYFSLLNFAFEHWDVDEPRNDIPFSFLNEDSENREIDGFEIETPLKNFDRFRNDVVVMAGYYTCTYGLNGGVRLDAKSISFANMSQTEFEKLYSRTIDIVLTHILNNYSKNDLVEALLRYDG